LRWDGEAPRETQTRALRVHGNRCTFEITGRTSTGWHSVIGKLHTSNRSDIFVAMESVFKGGFGAEAEFAVAEPLANLPFYRAMECMHRARRDVYKRSPPNPERAETMLEEGLKTL